MIYYPQVLADLVTNALAAAQAAGELPTFVLPDITVQPSQKAGQGDYNTNAAMMLSKVAQQPPRQVAEIILKHLTRPEYLQEAVVAGAGFINFTLNPNALKALVETIIAEGSDTLCSLTIGAGKRAQVEFVSANPSGPITIGHARNAVTGDTMARLLEAAGYDVQREYYFNNAGNQMVLLGKSLQARYLQALGLDVAFPQDGYRGDYISEYAQKLVEERGDTLKDADWQPFKEYAEAQMFAWIKRTLERVNIRHDQFFNENSLFESGAVWDTLKAMEANGYIYRAKEWEGASAEEHAKAADLQPATWFRTTRFGDEKDRVMVKGDGVPTYTLPDIAYHRNKIERGFDLMVNVLGADHGQQYKVVAWGIQALGLPADNIHVIIIQMVKTMRDGKEFKISKRAGIFDTLDDLIDMVGADAIRFHMLGRSANTHLTFDVDEVVKQSNDNPVYYIQNAHVRCASILRSAQERGICDEGADLTLLGEDELTFIRKVLELQDIIALAVNQYEPHRIAFYAKELAATFHPIYDRVRAMGDGVPEDVGKARLRFYRAAQVAFQRVLGLMGMSAPERM